MKKLTILAFAAAVLLIAAAYLLRVPEETAERGSQLVMLNEIEQLAVQGSSTEAAEKAAALRTQL